ncbi:MAG: bis(5'-nucleosyl)-tetraphosphatase (symmetrical) YqeK [Clostridia bacterium]|nr:bis(5'-nucleosyl)-tetraphosphatase (symmetrical) YqeK [Clostridia bacterium]
MITEAMLDTLRTDIAKELGDYRMAHTLGVEQAAARLAALYCPEEEHLLRAAALLHDVTKELTDEEQLAIFAAHGVTLRPDEASSPKVWHGMTAALIIPEKYPEFACDALLSAVRWHTTGRAGMTLCDWIVYLADLIEEGRTFPDCVALREAFWSADPAQMTMTARRRHLRDVLLLSFEKTLPRLQRLGGVICLDSIAAWKDLQNRIEI